MSTPFAAFGKSMQAVTGPSVWNRAEITENTDWQYQLSAQTLLEIKENVANIDASNAVLRDINPENFPLPSFVEQAKLISREIGYGRGIAKLGGLDIENYTLDQAKLIYLSLIHI